jgi:hypothetical protein
MQDPDLGQSAATVTTPDGTDMLSEYESDKAVLVISNSTDAVMSSPETHFTFAVHTDLTDTPELPPEMRLEVYKMTFPETDRSIGDWRFEEVGYNQTV